MVDKLSIESLTVEEALTLFPRITEDVKAKCKDILLNKLDNTSQFCNDTLETEDLKNIQAYSQSDISKDKSCLKELKDKVIHLKTEKDNLKAQIDKLEAKLKLIDTKKEKLHKKTTELKEKRDVIQVCKLLTNTSFTYRGSSTMGYSVCPTTRNITPFVFKSETSQEERTSALYNVIKSVSTDVDQN